MTSRGHHIRLLFQMQFHTDRDPGVGKCEIVDPCSSARVYGGPVYGHGRGPAEHAYLRGKQSLPVPGVART